MKPSHILDALLMVVAIVIIVVLSGCGTFEPYKDGKSAQFSGKDGWSLKVGKRVAVQKQF